MALVVAVQVARGRIELADTRLESVVL